MSTLTESHNLPDELQDFAEMLDKQPANVRELFHYALVMLMVEDGKAEVIERQEIDGRTELTIRTSAIEIFQIMKPEVSEELLARMSELAREELMRDGWEAKTDD